MGIKKLRKYTDRELIMLLDRHLGDGWSTASFPTKLGTTQTSFYPLLKEKPYFAEYYHRKVKERQKKTTTFMSEACKNESH